MSRPINPEEGGGSLTGTNDFSVIAVEGPPEHANTDTGLHSTVHGGDLAIESPPQHANTDTGLHSAVQRGDLDEVRRILGTQSKLWCNKMPLMTKKDENGMCLIHIMAKEGRHDIIRVFVEVVPNCINIRSKDHKTALHFAVEHGQLEVVRVLLSDRNAKIGKKMVSHHRDKDGNTALHFAAIYEVQPQIVRELLKWPGVSVNTVNNEGLSALDLAAHSSTVATQQDRRIKSGKIKKILAAVADGGRYSRHSKEKESKIVEVDTLVASLIATITFAAIFQIPGGIEDDKNSTMYGGAKFALTHGFLCFSILNSFALYTSLIVLIAWFVRERGPTKFVSAHRSKVALLSTICLEGSIVSTGLAFLCAYLVIVPPLSIKRLSEEEYSRLNVLLFSVSGTASFPFLIAWFSFSTMAAHKVSKFILARKLPTVHNFSISILCTLGVCHCSCMGVGESSST